MKYFCITPLFLIYYIFHSFVIWNHLSFQFFWYWFFQNWGDYTDMSQGMTVYVTLAADVLLICWFGTQLTQRVRKMDCCYCCWCCKHITIIMCMKPHINWEIMPRFKYWSLFFPIRQSALNFIWQSVENMSISYHTIYKAFLSSKSLNVIKRLLSNYVLIFN